MNEEFEQDMNQNTNEPEREMEEVSQRIPVQNAAPVSAPEPFAQQNSQSQQMNHNYGQPGMSQPQQMNQTYSRPGMSQPQQMNQTYGQPGMNQPQQMNQTYGQPGMNQSQQMNQFYTQPGYQQSQSQQPQYQQPQQGYTQPGYQQNNMNQQMPNQPVFMRTVQQPPVQNEKKGYAIASMVLGIVSIVLCSLFVITTPCGIVGLVLGYSYKKNGANSSMATAGIICSIIGLALSLIYGCFWIIEILLS